MKYVRYIGLDWGHEVHQACITDAEGKVLHNQEFKNDGEGLKRLLKLLGPVAEQASQVAIAVEAHRLPLVETLMERGFAVYVVNPKQLDRFRDRLTVAGSKDDRLDAKVLARCLRTDRDLLRYAQADTPEVVRLRSLTRIDGELKREKKRLGSQVYSELMRYFPAALNIASVDEPLLWDMLLLLQNPTRARKLPAKALKRVLKEHRIRRITAAQVHELLQKPAFYVTPGVVEAAWGHLKLLIDRLKLVQKQLDSVTADIKKTLDALPQPESDDEEKCEHRDIDIIRSWPGIGDAIAATMLAEAPEAIRRRDYKMLRAWAGVAPVTKRSGKARPFVCMRRACNARLRNALYYAACRASNFEEGSKAYYKSLRQRGLSHARASRSVADRLLRAIIAALKAGQLYKTPAQLLQQAA